MFLLWDEVLAIGQIIQLACIAGLYFYVRRQTVKTTRDVADRMNKEIRRVKFR